MTTLPFSVELAATLRGTRRYVHSTDLYETIVSVLRDAGLPVGGTIDLRIRSVLLTQPIYTVSMAGAPAVPGAAATCSVGDGEGAVRVDAVPSDRPVVGRREYDETPAARLSTITDRTAVLAGDTGLAPIEAVTALAVHLHKVVLPPPSGQRWMLAQMRTIRPLAPSDSRDLTLTIDRVVGGTMTRTSIAAEDGSIGTLMFILARG